MQRPLADEIRPKTLDEVVGQRHLLAPGAVLRRLIESGTEANMVFYGLSGAGGTVEDHIRIGPFFNEPAQQGVRAQQMLLPHHLVQTLGPDAVR